MELTERQAAQLEVLQLYGAGLLSRRTAVERLDLGVDVDDELARLGWDDERKVLLNRRSAH